MNHPIAIIGLGCEFPGGRGVAGFRKVVREGIVSTAPVPKDRWDHAAFYSPEVRAMDKTFAQKAGFLEDVTQFAPRFFKIPMRRARLMDPQQRLMLEVARQAIEDAGYADKRLPRNTGVFVGASLSDHKDIVTSRILLPMALNGRLGRPPGILPEAAAAMMGHLPPIQVYSNIGQQLNMIAANVSQAFDLKGPAFAIDTACSSSLMALHEAVVNLRAGRISAAVVGGVYVILDPVLMVTFAKMGAISRRDTCRPFSSGADGFVLGEGAGAVVLKRLEDAQRDGDRVWAVIRGVGSTNDGNTDSPVAPSTEGQLETLRMAYTDAGVDPATVGLIEAHGTATVVGDRVELSALEQFFPVRTEKAAISSVKANIGHGLAASGIAALIKVALSLDERVRPALVGRDAAERGASVGRFAALEKTQAWDTPAGVIRRAGVSSFGFGGTNVHVVLEEAPAVRRAPAPSVEIPVCVSAPSAVHLAEYLSQLAATEASPQDLAYTLGRRRVDKVRIGFVAADAQSLRSMLQQAVVAVEKHREMTGILLNPGSPVDLPAGAGPAKSAQETVERFVAHGILPAPEAFGSEARLAWLPCSLLQTRRVWLLDASSSDRPTGAENLAEVVVDAAASVSGRPRMSLKMTDRLGADLGFDSMMAAELASELAARLGGVLPPRMATFKAGMTLDELCKELELHAKPKEIAGAATGETRRFNYSLETHPWMSDHAIDGVPTLPAAAAMDLMLHALRGRIGAGTLLLRDFVVSGGIRLRTPTMGVEVSIAAHEGSGHEISVASLSGGASATGFRGRGERAEGELPPLVAPSEGTVPSLTIDEFYARHAFHGPRFRGIVSTPMVGDSHVSGWVRSSAGEIPAAEVDILALDSALQLALFWVRDRLQCQAWPMGFAEYRHLAPYPQDGVLECVAVLRERQGQRLVCDMDLRDGLGNLVGQLRGLRAELGDKVRPFGGLDPERTHIGAFPEIAALRARKAELAATGLRNPYFVRPDEVDGVRVKIAGRECVNFATYDYLGLAKSPGVIRAAQEAIARFGTSVSASRLASGERGLHLEFERKIANFLGCEAAIAFVSGHATNVTVIGHLMGPEDLIVHDSLAHDSILAGARLSGARRRSFPHNDMAALESILVQMRPSVRRVLIAVEGVYSMDGDMALLPQVIELKKRYGALLLVDEAHSLGVIGRTGRGIGEHFGVDRTDVDLWMGTMSKALASCGGYIAGSAELVDYLKFSAPGFVYSVGISPPNAAAALAALNELEAHPELPQKVQAQAATFLQLCRDRGIDTGLSSGSAVVPCIIGASLPAVRLSERLFDRGFNVQPILHPAVVEPLARLRFFVSTAHSTEIIQAAAAALVEELAAVRASSRFNSDTAAKT